MSLAAGTKRRTLGVAAVLRGVSVAAANLDAFTGAVVYLACMVFAGFDVALDIMICLLHIIQPPLPLAVLI